MGQDKKKTAPSLDTAPELGSDREMGSALRSVYQRTVEEKVPDDLLDLLGKLS
ncbi:NepR family anti-sigma factor [Sphingomonas rubra]|uniref:NepR family anti-sigma factor n=1 Tax=Sphingomonas rubra TaxID=634430 RepID=UPI001FE0513E|nr:NepR family anti-sigma factor [Sphingomonas rubra]